MLSAGCNILSFQGEKDEAIRDFTIHHSINGFFSIRKGKWKYTPHLGSGGFSSPSEVHPIENEPPGTLYDLSSDPGETENLYDVYPEVVDDLQKLLDEARKSGE